MAATDTNTGMFMTGSIKPAVVPIQIDVDKISKSLLSSTNPSDVYNLQNKVGSNVTNDASLNAAKQSAFSDFTKKVIGAIASGTTIGTGNNVSPFNISANIDGSPFGNTLNQMKDYDDGLVPSGDGFTFTEQDLSDYYPPTVTGDSFSGLNIPNADGLPDDAHLIGSVDELVNKYNVEHGITPDSTFISVPFKAGNGLPDFELQIPVDDKLLNLKNKLDLQNIAKEYFKSKNMDLNEFSSFDYDAQGNFDDYLNDKMQMELAKGALQQNDGDLLTALATSVPGLKDNKDFVNLVRNASKAYAADGNVEMFNKAITALQSGDVADMGDLAIIAGLYSTGYGPVAEVALDTTLQHFGMSRKDLINEGLGQLGMEGTNVYKVSHMNNNNTLNIVKDNTGNNGLSENDLQMALKSQELINQGNHANTQMNLINNKRFQTTTSLSYR